MALSKWLRGWLSGKPHFIIGTTEDPYLYRWYVLPRNAWLNVYLHKFLRDDEDRALHDHPWWFVSFMLWGTTGKLFRRASYIAAGCPSRSGAQSIGTELFWSPAWSSPRPAGRWLSPDGVRANGGFGAHRVSCIGQCSPNRRTQGKLDVDAEREIK